MEIEERGVKIRIKVVEKNGFGDEINCEERWREC
jgi:septin family protein